MLGDRVNIYPVKGYSITVNLKDEASQKAAPWVSLLDDKAKIVTSRLGPDRFRIAGTAEFNGYNRDIRQVRAPGAHGPPTSQHVAAPHARARITPRTLHCATYAARSLPSRTTQVERVVPHSPRRTGSTPPTSHPPIIRSPSIHHPFHPAGPDRPADQVVQHPLPRD